MSKLIITNSEFKSTLNDRIGFGLKLIEKINSKNCDFETLNREMNRWDDYNKEFLKQSFDNLKNEYLNSYSGAGLTYFGDIMRSKQGDPHLTLRNLLEDKIDNLSNLENKANLLKTQISKKVTDNHILSKHEVFIVHGHDNEAKIEAARFVDKLGFKPIILHEQASSGRTIIEKIERYSDVGFGIVLYTPCDIGSVQKENLKLKNRARQNVVFEHGFLIGKIGRHNVCALVKSDIETPNDISGVVYITMDSGSGWQLQLAKEMKKAGYDVDLNKL
ncbi:TIR domain-containing protein [Arenibacter sp. ARW7G5Y1]|uniref:TIR domain-containing protein n=1 Tax=Arenibacter sp. ARW7G5Y1 TaxID=2135619 RepID=UPI000D7618C1|nr:nucleotide-binding protein [Arenibacter sp. ARW7G5Y1]PXX30643.1 putative nucleotide-binding protein with TIR-like domain [Arenibacter sp. ARW7G5Y1]